MGTSSLDLMSGGYSDSEGNFDIASYFSSAEQAGRVVEVDESDFDAINSELDDVNQDRHAEWSTVQKYLDRIKK